MTTRSHDARSQDAGRVLDALPQSGWAAITLRVQCAHNHHVVVVYDTVDGLIYAAPVRGRSHGAHR
jgi:hypothetical protein